MPISIAQGAPTLFVQRAAYERSGLTRAALDARLGLTDAEFRVDGEIVALGPIYDVDALSGLLEELETLGLSYFEDYFELSGNWPEWLPLLVNGVRARSAPGSMMS